MARAKKTEEQNITPSPLGADKAEPTTGGKESSALLPTEETENEEAEVSQEPEGEGEEEEVPVKKEPWTKIIPRHVGDVLKVYHRYQNLYVDDKGGAYTEDTIEAIRGEAELYKNPYYIAKP